MDNIECCICGCQRNFYRPFGYNHEKFNICFSCIDDLKRIIDYQHSDRIEMVELNKRRYAHASKFYNLFRRLMNAPGNLDNLVYECPGCGFKAEHLNGIEYCEMQISHVFCEKDSNKR